MSGLSRLSLVDFRDDELILDQDETRLVLKFFWPQQSHRIDGLVVGNDARRLAQSALVAGIDGSYAMGFVEALFRSSARPGVGIGQIARKFARSAIKHHFRHASGSDLQDVKIYEVLRLELSRQLRSRFEMLMNGIALTRQPVFVQLNHLATA